VPKKIRQPGSQHELVDTNNYDNAIEPPLLRLRRKTILGVAPVASGLAI
jgi:hypothetical protein